MHTSPAAAVFTLKLLYLILERLQAAGRRGASFWRLASSVRLSHKPRPQNRTHAVQAGSERTVVGGAPLFTSSINHRPEFQLQFQVQELYWHRKRTFTLHLQSEW